jgi:geranylgeranyl diphosphate synthase type II
MQAVETAEPSTNTFDLKNYLVSRKNVVESALEASLATDSPYNKKIIESMKYSLMAGGKRIRPIMVLAAYEMIAGTGPEAAYEMAMPTATAIEMIHTMSLIHDDLPSMDDDDLRRGMPTNHVKYGEDIAILAGDAMLSEAFAHVARHTPKSVPAERTLDVVRRLGDAVGPVGLAAGQVLDLECEAKHDSTLEELRWIHLHKTAVLLEVSVVAGAILAGATEEEIEACSTYARDIGLAFQVADDILDVTATSEELGKTAAKDLDSDKTTYVKLLGLDGARAEAERLKEEAVASLKRFGDKAGPLLAITEYIVKRSN